MNLKKYLHVQKKAIVLGGTEDHIRLIEILKEKGYYTYLIDYYEDPPAKNVADEHVRESTLDKEKVLEIVRGIDPQLVIAACIDQALLTMAYVCEELALPCHITYQQALHLTNKAYMKNVFQDNGIPSSKFIVLESNHNVEHETEGFGFPLVVKPSDSNSSKGITKVLRPLELKDACNDAMSLSRAKKVIVEEFCEGEEFSVDLVVRDSEPSLLLVTKNKKLKMNSRNFTIAQSIFPATDDPEITRAIVEIARQIVKAYKLENGPLLIQLIHRAGKLSVVEFSSRIGGGSKHHLIKTITGFDVLIYFTDLLLGNQYRAGISKNYQYACVNYIYALQGRIESFEGFDALEAAGIIESGFFYKTTGMDVTGHLSSGDRAAGYLVASNDLQDLHEKIGVADQQIKVLESSGNDLMIHGIHNCLPEHDTDY